MLFKDGDSSPCLSDREIITPKPIQKVTGKIISYILLHVYNIPLLHLPASFPDKIRKFNVYFKYSEKFNQFFCKI